MARMDDAVYRRRLRDGSLTVGGEPPVDACVKRLVKFQKALLAAAVSTTGGNGAAAADGSSSAGGETPAAACANFCEALDNLDFHIRQTRHAGRIVAAETESLTTLQGEIDRLQAAARHEIAALKGDLKAAYQTHLNKEEYEASAVKVNRFKSRAVYTARIAALEGELHTLAQQHAAREDQLDSRRQRCQELLHRIQALKVALKEEAAEAAAKRKAARRRSRRPGEVEEDDDEEDEDEEEDEADTKRARRGGRGRDDDGDGDGDDDGGGEQLGDDEGGGAASPEAAAAAAASSE